MPHLSYPTGSRRRPYPYDLYIEGTKLMLQPDADGNMVAQKSKTLDATAPIDYTYSSANPYKERTFEWMHLYGGYGQAVEPLVLPPRRCDHTEYVDTSINGVAFKGPRFETHVETINASAGDVRQFIIALHGGADTLFAICENGVWRRTADNSWTASLTIGLGGTALPAGQYPQSALRFKHRGAGTPVDSLYLACATGNLWRYDGTTWTQAAAAAGPGTGAVDGEARYLERIGDEFWVAGDYWIVKCTDDPMVRASYAGVIYIGDQTNKITWLRQIENTLYIFKEDGLYTVTDTGLDQEILPTLRGKNNPRNGRNAAVWIDRMWIPYGNQTLTLDSGGNVKADGLEQVLENTSDVKGRWACGAGHNTWFLYEIYYNEQNTKSYLVKHGTWIEAEGGGSLVPGTAQFADAHHGALYEWDKEATGCAIIGGIHSSGNERLYVGFEDGTTEWCVLPKNGPNPTTDSSCEFTGNTSWIYLPIHHMGYQADNKLYRGITVAGPKLTNTEWVEVQYRLDFVNTFSEWTTLVDEEGSATYTLPNQRKDFSDDPPVYGRAIQIRVKLVKDVIGASPANLTPIIEGIAVHEALRPSVALEWVWSVRCASYLPRHNGTVDRRRGAQIREEVLSHVSEVGNVNVLLPDGEEEQMTLIDYRESAANWTRRRDHEWLVQITGIQLRTLSRMEVGVASGLTYETLETFTLGELESII